MTDTRRQTGIVRAEQLVKTYTEGSGTVDVLRGVDLSVAAGEMLAIVGASGSGKSTLLHILGLLDQADAGRLWVAGEASHGLNEARRCELRNRCLGFVYQFHHLLPEFTAVDNVAMPLIVRRMSRAAAREQARAMLEGVGLQNRGHHFPGQLSGGERQRVALARALVTQPACVLADEPTGNLDRETARAIFDLLVQVNERSGTAIVVVTHDTELAGLAHRRLRMESGQLFAAE